MYDEPSEYRGQVSVNTGTPPVTTEAAEKMMPEKQETMMDTIYKRLCGIDGVAEQVANRTGFLLEQLDGPTPASIETEPSAPYPPGRLHELSAKLDSIERFQSDVQEALSRLDRLL